MTFWGIARLIAFPGRIVEQILSNSGKESFPKSDRSGILGLLSEHDRQPIGICDSPVIETMGGDL